VEIRTLQDSEVERALDLFSAVADEGLWLATETPFDRAEARESWHDLLASDDGTLLVAADGGQPVGLAVLVGTTEAELGMLVRADRRREGIGDALVEAAVAWARGRGVRRVVLHVFPHNVGAIALYRKHGFGARGTVRHGYPRRNGERWDAIRMVKDLGAAATARDAK
jgi:ribosomal protein S18 acetylase RimI-like enzyme